MIIVYAVICLVALLSSSFDFLFPNKTSYKNSIDKSYRYSYNQKSLDIISFAEINKTDSNRMQELGYYSKWKSVISVLKHSRTSIKDATANPSWGEDFTVLLKVWQTDRKRSPFKIPFTSFRKPPDKYYSSIFRPPRLTV